MDPWIYMEYGRFTNDQKFNDMNILILNDDQIETPTDFIRC